MGDLIAKITKIFTKPREYWDEQLAEPGEIKDLLIPQMLLLAAVPAVAYLIGVGVLGGIRMMSLGIFGRWLTMSIVAVIIQYGMSIGMWIAFGYIIDALAQPFGAQRDIGQSMKLATGAVIPVWLGQALSITSVSSLGMIGGLAGFGYSCYFLYLGLPVMNGTAEDKAVGYTAAAMGCLIAVMLVVGILTCVPVTCCMAGAFIH